MPDGLVGGGGVDGPTAAAAAASKCRSSSGGSSGSGGASVGYESGVRQIGRKLNVNDFLFGRMIGEGSFSTVFLARETLTERQFAIKVCDKKHIVKEKKQAAVLREKHILSELCRRPHPFIVRLHCTFHDESRLYFVITYAKNGDLLKYIHKVGNFNVECTRFYSGELLAALRYLHRAGVVHRDLKPENVLMTEQMHIMLTDFGSAQILPQHSSGAASMETNLTSTDETATNESAEAAFRVKPMVEDRLRDRQPDQMQHNYTSEVSGGRRKKRNSFVGTAQYVSPEVLTGGPVSAAMDLWALGCIIYQMVAGLPPFRGQAEYHIFQNILKLDYRFPDEFNVDAKRLVESLLKYDPKDRPTIDCLLQDPFFESVNIDKLCEQTPPQIVPFIPGTSEETRWDLVGAPGLDESQMSRLLGLHLGDAVTDTQELPSERSQAEGSISSSSGQATAGVNVRQVAPNDLRKIMRLSDQELEKRLTEQRTKNKWHRFVEGNLILKEGFIDKRKGLFPRRRMLLLTTGPHLYYVDPEKMVLKGQIPWSSALYTEPKNFKTFFVHTPNRTYNLEDPKGYALRWCKAINDVYEATYGSRNQSGVPSSITAPPT